MTEMLEKVQSEEIDLSLLRLMSFWRFSQKTSDELTFLSKPAIDLEFMDQIILPEPNAAKELPTKFFFHRIFNECKNIHSLNTAAFDTIERAIFNQWN